MTAGTITYVGNFEPEWSTENDVRLALEDLDFDVIMVQENKTNPSILRQAALQSDLLLWTGTGDWWQYGLDPVLDLVHELAAKGTPSATYHLDTFWSTGRDGRRWWREAMFHMGHVFTGDPHGPWENSGIQHHYLPAGVRRQACFPGVPQERFTCDVAFVGSNGLGYHEDVWRYRRDLCDALRDMCRRNGWSYRNPGGDELKVPRGEMNDFYASAKVTVGDSLCPQREKSLYWSDRVYEATGRHGLLIMPFIAALEEEFDRELAMYRWGNWDNLEQQLKLALHSDAYAPGREACAKITAERHTYTHRMQALLQTVMP